jgi:ADP-heptose:LPS heptosyltransferase
MGHDVVISAWPRSVRILEGWDKALVTIDHPIVHTAEADHVIISGCGAIWQDEWTKGRIWHAKPDKNPWIQHEVDYYMDVARELGYEGKVPDPEVQIEEDNLRYAEEAVPFDQGHYVCVAAGYLKSNHWPLKHAGNDLYSKLVTQLDIEGENVVFVGSRDDWEDANQVRNYSDYMNRFENLCGFSSDVKDTAAVMKNAKLVVGNDGGLMHVAAAVGTKTVTIFTFTNPVKNRPCCHGEVVMVDCEDRVDCQHGKWSRCSERGCLSVPFEEVWEKTKRNL